MGKVLEFQAFQAFQPLYWTIDCSASKQNNTMAREETRKSDTISEVKGALTSFWKFVKLYLIQFRIVYSIYLQNFI